MAAICPISTYTDSTTHACSQGIIIPTHFIYHLHLLPAILLTWVRLYCLVWDARVTSALSIQQLVQLTGKIQVTIFRHLSQLKSISALDWHSTGDGRIIISFDDGQSNKPKRSADVSNLPDFNVVNSETQKVPEPAFYFPE
jgi:hypothetical protein